MADCCCICSGELTTERYRLWEGSERSNRRTDLFSQLRSVVGEPRLQLKCGLVCSVCRRRILTAAKLRERFQQTRRELLQKVVVAQPTSTITPTTTTQTTPARMSATRPEKRPLGSPLVKTGASPQTKRFLPESTIATKRSATQSGLAQCVARRELFLDSAESKLSLTSVPTGILPSRIPVYTGKTLAPLPKVSAVQQESSGMGYPAASKIPRPTHSVVATVPLAQGTGVGKGQDTEQHQSSRLRHLMTSKTPRTTDVVVSTVLPTLVPHTGRRQDTEQHENAATEIAAPMMYDIVAQAVPDSPQDCLSMVVESIAKSKLDPSVAVKSILIPGPLLDAAVKHILQQLDNQCVALCQKKNFRSILRGISPEDLHSFSFDKLASEWSSFAPLLLQFLSTVANVVPTDDNVFRSSDLISVCTAGAVLLRARNVHMSALHHIAGLILFHGNASKLAHVRLNHLQVAVSPDATLGMVDRFAARFDHKVLKWMEEIKSYHSGQRDDCPTYQIVGDNVDLHQHPTHRSMERKEKDHHWFHLFATRDRITGISLSDDAPTADIATLPLQTFMPSVEECHQLREEFGVLISRVLVEKMAYFSPLKPVVPAHILHKHSDVAKNKSEFVPLGVLTKCEQYGDEMVDILSYVHKYVPSKKNGDMLPVFFGGDQLTRERASGAQDAQLQASDRLGRLQGVIPKVEDWHALVIFYQVIWNHLYDSHSFCDKGTLKQLANVINRPKLPKKVKNDFRAVEDFFGVVLDAHVVAAALKFFAIDNLGDTPTKHAFSGDLNEASLDERRTYLSKCMSEFLTQFTPNHIQTLDEKNASSIDGVFEYARSVIGLGLMARNFSDATREGDGARLILCWKFFMLHFKSDGRTKYAVEAFNLLAQINATLTPRMAYRLMWNRTCNPKGGEGNNISLDLRNEHLNRTFKDDLNTFRANISEKSIARSAQAIGELSDMLTAVDALLQVKTPSGRHVGPKVMKDFDAILRVLTDEDILASKTKREHATFKKFTSDPFASLRKDPKAFQKWLISRRKAATIEHKIWTRVY